MDITMSQPIDNGGTPTYGEGQEQQGTTEDVNQHWQQYLQDVPQEFHEKVIPAFKAWDAGVQDMVQRVHSQYEPWKQITKQYDPQTTSWALNVYDALSNDPQTVYEALGEWMKQNNIQQPQQQTGSPSGQGQGQQELPTEDQNNPFYQQVMAQQQQLRLMTDYLKAQQQAQLDAQYSNQLDQDLNAAKQKYGLDEMGERFALGLMAANDHITMDQAAQQYVQYRDQIVQTHRPKPLLMGSGGGTPGQGIDVRKLDDKGTKDLVVQMLMANKAQQQ